MPSFGTQMHPSTTKRRYTLVAVVRGWAQQEQQCTNKRRVAQISKGTKQQLTSIEDTTARKMENGEKVRWTAGRTIWEQQAVHKQYCKGRNREIMNTREDKQHTCII
jgi:hypothetical protein